MKFSNISKSLFKCLSMEERTVNLVVGVMFLLCITLIAQEAWAADGSQDINVLSEIAHRFQQKAKAWSPVLQNYALVLFRWLLIADVCLMGIRLALKRAELDEVFVDFIRLILFAAFMFTVVLYFKPWANSLISGLGSIAEGELHAPRADPGEVFWAGLNIVLAIVKEFSLISPVKSIGFVICAIAITIVFALIAAQALLVMCEVYIVLNAGTILLGFGGSKITKDYAINFLRYSLAVSIKLFVMQLLLALAMDFVGDFKMAGTEYAELFVVIGASIVLLALTMTIPDICAGIVNGSHVSTGQAITSATSAVSMATMAAMQGVKGSVGGGRNAIDAVREASQYANQAGMNGMGKAGHMAKSLHNAAQASAPDTFGQKLSSNLKAQREAFEMEKGGEE